MLVCKKKVTKKTILLYFNLHILIYKVHTHLANICVSSLKILIQAISQYPELSLLFRSCRENRSQTELTRFMMCSLFSSLWPALCFPQQSSIESQDTASYKAHTYTDRKLPSGFTWLYFNLQNQHKRLSLRGSVGVQQTPHIHLWHRAAHGWCSHGTCMVCLLL